MTSPAIRAREEWNSRMAEPDNDGSPRGPLVGQAIAALLLAVGLWLSHELGAASRTQDCVMSGRTNCNEIVPAP